MLKAWLLIKDGNKAKVEKNLISESIRRGTVDTQLEERKKKRLKQEELKIDRSNIPMTDLAEDLKTRINVGHVLDGMISVIESRAEMEEISVPVSLLPPEYQT